MNHREFVQRVQARAQLGTEAEAVTAIRATLESLGERIALPVAQTVAQALPEEVGRHLRSTARERGESFTTEEFLQRAQSRSGRDGELLHRQVSAVFVTLHEALPDSARAILANYLPGSFREMLGGQALRGEGATL